jgi:uncharacterized membrane protein YphA (DoxX/SURF4 family)
MTETEVPSGGAAQTTVRRFSNGWPVVPLRAFFGVLFVFAGYAKFNYPGFFDPASPAGLKATIDSVKADSPIGGMLGPLSDHPSLFGHITAFAEIAIGLGLLLGLLTRIAALGGIALTVIIALSVNYNGIKEYTASSGWFTSVDLAVAAALTVFVIGGAGPLSLDGLVGRVRARRNARDDGEPAFRDNELNESRARLQGAPPVGEHPTEQLPTMQPQPDDDPNSLWGQGRRE